MWEGAGSVQGECIDIAKPTVGTEQAGQPPRSQLTGTVRSITPQMMCQASGLEYTTTVRNWEREKNHNLSLWKGKCGLRQPITHRLPVPPQQHLREEQEKGRRE